jgi:hypothetical protein
MEMGWPYTSSAGLQHDNLDLRGVRFGSSIGFSLSFFICFIFVCLFFHLFLGGCLNYFYALGMGGVGVGYNDDDWMGLMVGTTMGWMDDGDQDDGGRG